MLFIWQTGISISILFFFPLLLLVVALLSISAHIYFRIYRKHEMIIINIRSAIWFDTNGKLTAQVHIQIARGGGGQFFGDDNSTRTQFEWANGNRNALLDSLWIPQPCLHSKQTDLFYMECMHVFWLSISQPWYPVTHLNRPNTNFHIFIIVPERNTEEKGTNAKKGACISCLGFLLLLIYIFYLNKKKWKKWA